MDHLANSANESHQLLNADHPEDVLAPENREPIGSSAVTPAWVNRARLQAQ
jgi:hypothetical protein